MPESVTQTPPSPTRDLDQAERDLKDQGLAIVEGVLEGDGLKAARAEVGVEFVQHFDEMQAVGASHEKEFDDHDFALQGGELYFFAGGFRDFEWRRFARGLGGRGRHNGDCRRQNCDERSYLSDRHNFTP